MNTRYKCTCCSFSLACLTTSARFLEVDMSLLLRWHSQHRSVIGLEHTIRGRSWSHRLGKVEVATHLCSGSLIPSWYCLWMLALLQLEGRRRISHLWHDTLLGRTRAYVSAKELMKSATLLISSKSRILVVSYRPPDFFCRGTTSCSLYHRMVLVILLRLTLER